MTNKEAIEIISRYEVNGCGYCHQGGDEIPEAFNMAINALKAQEPRVMTPADVDNIGPEDICAFIEIREETHMYACYIHQYDETHTEIMCDVPGMVTKLQNGCARLWTSRPTDEQREAEPWN